MRRIIPVLVIFVAPTAMLYTLWANPVSAGEDDVIYYYPLRKMVGQALRESRLPLQNPLEATGSPLLADPQSAVMYPPTWLFALIGPKPAYSLSIFMAFWIAGGGMYLYLRRLGLVGSAATFGAVAFMFCGFMVAHRVHLAMIHTAAFLPWGLWCIERLRSRPARAFAWMVPVAVLAITSGHWPTLIHIGLLWFVYLLVRGRPITRSLLVSAAALILAAVITAPQVFATAELLSQATRRQIGYATVGENSFFPAAGVLALFPMLMGSRTPNFFAQQWWGPWHLCEMLGYVGLVTVVLAASAVWRLSRKTDSALPAPVGGESQTRSIVRLWTWIGVGAGLWMLGYYLPTYRLIYMLPILGVVRCPARMLLAVDLALCVLAAVAVHTLVAGDAPADRRAEMLKRTVRRAATLVLPAAMLITLGIVTAAGAALMRDFPEKLPFLVGGARDALEAVRPGNPAVWVPLMLMLLTAVAVRTWAGSPRRRVGVLIVLVLFDLFFITRFVDVPAGGAVAPDPEVSPAAAWLKNRAPPSEEFRVYGLSDSYCHRPAELLGPKTCQSLGLATIANYGPFHSPAHAQLFGFDVCGFNRDWESLVRRNHLLSLYNVRYLIAAAPRYREVIESVRVPAGAVAEDGKNLLTDDWDLQRTEFDGGYLRLCTPLLWWGSIARQPLTVEPNVIYRIGFDARLPEGPAGSFLRAGIFQRFKDREDFNADELGLTVCPEQLGREWRHFEWTFRTPEQAPSKVLFRVLTVSSSTIEVRAVFMRESRWDVPIDLAGLGHPGRKVYRKLIELPALDPADPPVAIYENTLCLPRQLMKPSRPASGEQIEALKWPPKQLDDMLIERVPSVGMAPAVPTAGEVRLWLAVATLPGVVVYAFVVAMMVFCSRGGGKLKKRLQTFGHPGS